MQMKTLAATITVTTSLTLALSSQELSIAQRDLQRIRHELRHNYAGYQRATKRNGAKLHAAFARTMERCRSLEGKEADAVIRALLKQFGDGHLILHSKHSPALVMDPPPLFSKAREPVARPLSPQTMLLRLPSFAPKYRASIEKLVAENSKAIDTRTNLILDLRSNSGGSDVVFASILPLVSTGTFTVPRLHWSCTEDNAAAIEAYLQDIPAGAEATAGPMRQLVSDMREHLDQLTPLGKPTTYNYPPLEKPSRVALLVDRYTASSAEQLVLRALQGSKSRIYGERTFGAADLLNPRMIALPSGARTLMMAMSISQRGLDNSDPETGIKPDQSLPISVVRDTEGAVERVRKMLEQQGAKTPGYPVQSGKQPR